MDKDEMFLRECIADAKARRQTELYNQKSNYVVIADTLEEAKKYGCDCRKCSYRYFSTSASLRGQCFDDVSAFYVHTENPELWRDLLMCLAGDGRPWSHGPIFYTPSGKYFQRQVELAILPPVVVSP